MEKALPAIPAKRYFTIGEVSDLCGVKPYVLRYWEQEFAQLKPMKRRGNRRYYQHHEVLLVRRIRELLYEQGFTINGARNQLLETAETLHGQPPSSDESDVELSLADATDEGNQKSDDAGLMCDEKPLPSETTRPAQPMTIPLTSLQLRQELVSIRDLLLKVLL
jgi:DNA-binding transcriptional MerR regulator